VRNHIYEIVNTWADGKFAYQFAKAGVEFTAPTGAKILGRGFTVADIRKTTRRDVEDEASHVQS
jgi:hypothetical protein